MVKKKYKARKGAPFSQENAQIYGECLDEIAKEKNGTVKPQDVVKEAKKKSSPLYGYFDWDDDSAGEKYRLHQARNLINSIIVVVKYDHKEKEQKAFYSVNESPNEEDVNKVYVTMERVMTEPELRKQVLERALKEVEYWQQRYMDYNELGKIFVAIKITKKKLKK